MSSKMETPEEKARRIGVPVIPPRRPIPKDNNPVTAVCGECGLEIKGQMMYSCPKSNCPVWPKATL